MRTTQDGASSDCSESATRPASSSEPLPVKVVRHRPRDGCVRVRDRPRKRRGASKAIGPRLLVDVGPEDGRLPFEDDLRRDGCSNRRSTRRMRWRSRSRSSAPTPASRSPSGKRAAPCSSRPPTRASAAARHACRGQAGDLRLRPRRQGADAADGEDDPRPRRRADPVRLRPAVRQPERPDLLRRCALRTGHWRSHDRDDLEGWGPARPLSRNPRASSCSALAPRVGWLRRSSSPTGRVRRVVTRRARWVAGSKPVGCAELAKTHHHTGGGPEARPRRMVRRDDAYHLPIGPSEDQSTRGGLSGVPAPPARIKTSWRDPSENRSIAPASSTKRSRPRRPGCHARGCFPRTWSASMLGPAGDAPRRGHAVRSMLALRASMAPGNIHRSLPRALESRPAARARSLPSHLCFSA